MERSGTGESLGLYVAEFGTGKPLCLKVRGTALVKVVGLQDDGDSTLRIQNLFPETFKDIDQDGHFGETHGPGVRRFDEE